MSDLRLLIPGAIVFCYFIYLSVSLFLSNWRRRERLQEQQRVRERVEQSLEQERLDEELQHRVQLEQKIEVNKTLRMQQIMNALKFEVHTDGEDQTASCGNSDDNDADDNDDDDADSDSDVDNMESQECQDEELNGVGNSLSAQILSSERKGNKPECVICLQTYNAGQVLCSAKTRKCHHIFHEECAIGWLQESSECPLCRVDLLAATEVSV
ncbi:MAG: hypothetical protein SGBAC_008995 [Bacillariaceae sp.]